MIKEYVYEKEIQDDASNIYFAFVFDQTVASWGEIDYESAGVSIFSSSYLHFNTSSLNSNGTCL